MNRQPYDAFISYATEDEAYAQKLEFELTFRGFKIWYAPLSLNVGDRLLDSINAGLNLSKFGIIIISPEYIRKQWTGYELDVLHRQHIEKNKRLLPIWHNITKGEIDLWNPGLTGIVGLKSSMEGNEVVKKVTAIISDNAPLRGVVPVYENPSWRFLQGLGELYANTENGGAFNIFEAVEFPDDNFPIFVDGSCHTKKELVFAVAKAIFYQNRETIRISSDEQWSRLIILCKSYGFDTQDPCFDPAACEL